MVISLATPAPAQAAGSGKVEQFAEGRGDGSDKPPGASMASFADPAFQSSRTDAELAAAITNGKGVMPKFGDQINSMGVSALVAHIRRLGQPTAAP